MTSHAAPASIDDLLGHASWARKLARALVGEDADDLLQETWMAALRVRPGRDRPLRPWLREVLRNRARNRARDRDRREARHAAAATGALREELGPEQLAARVQVQAVLGALVLELPEPFRQTVLLRYYDDLTSPEIARVMGAPEGTVRRRLKEAVERLRRSLDDRHGGRREVWLRAVAPLIPAARAGRAVAPAAGSAGVVLGLLARVAAGRVVTGAVVALVLLVGAALWWLGTGRDAGGGGGPEGTAATPSPEGDGETAGRGRRARLAALAPTGGGGAGGPASGSLLSPGATLADCQLLLGQIRGDLDDLEEDFRQNAPHTMVFAEGTENDQAREALLPVVEQALRGDGAAAPSFALECRTWVCKLRVLTPSGGGGFNLTGDFLAGRVRGRSSQAAIPTRDPLSGAPLSETTVHLLLFSPSGGRDSPPRKVAGAQPLPGDLAACRAELARGEARITTILTTLEQHRSPFKRHERGTPDPDLTARFKRVVDRALAATPERWQAQVDCRASVCRVNVPAVPPAEADRWRRPLQIDAEAQRWIYSYGADGNGGTVYAIGDPTRPLGTVILKKMVRAFRTSPPVADCYARFPERGRLEARFRIPDEKEPNDDGETDRISLRLGGTLAGTPLGRCVEDEARGALLGARMPERARGGVVYANLDFPQ